MDKSIIDQIVADSEALLKAAAPAFEAQQKLAAVTSELEATRSELVKSAEQAADFFESHGMLTNDKRAAFVDRLVKNPGELFGAMQTYTDAISVREAGSPGQKSASIDGKSVDPIAAFAMS